MAYFYLWKFFMPKKIEQDYVMLPWNYSYKSSSDVRMALTEFRKALFENKVSKNFSQPRLIDQETFATFSIVRVDPLKKSVDWENFQWDEPNE